MPTTTNPEKQPIHIYITTTGVLMWYASLIGELIQAQPYSTIGIYLSPVIILAGIIFWAKHYRKTRGHYPKFSSISKNIIFSAGKHTVKSEFISEHLGEFFTFFTLIIMCFSLQMAISFKTSDAFTVTKNYCENNPEIIAKTGEIKYYSALVFGSYSSMGQTEKFSVSFTIVGQKGNFSTHVRLVKNDGVWKMEKFEL
jgi:hypothetical protein